MEFIRTLRERHQTHRENNIHQEAEELIKVRDFDDSLFIAYAGVPLVPIEKSWATKEIIEKLTTLRQNYVNAKIKQFNMPTAVL